LSERDSGLLATVKALLLHQPRDAVASMAASFFAQRILHAWTPIGLPASDMNLLNLSGQHLILRTAWAGMRPPLLPSVVPAGGNFQVQAERQDGVISFHRVDPFIPLEGGSERMPSVFFKMVHCSRK
jgi:hypothetical protein